MDQAARHAIFRAQVENVRSLKGAIGRMRRAVNDALRTNDQATVDDFTKVYALLFCAWAEANFSKLLHTPYGLELDEIRQVQEAKDRGIREAWKKCVDLGLGKVEAQRSGFVPNAAQRLRQAIDEHVYDPTLLRNKLAHGQWTVALNRENVSIQPNLTAELAALDIVKVSGWINTHSILADLVENLLESPKRTFVRTWYELVPALEATIEGGKRRSIDEHVTILKAKGRRSP